MDKPNPILVVSSDSKNRDTVKDILGLEGWEVICASTVSECEEMFANWNVDFVFCDRSLTDGTYRDILAITRLLNRNVRLVVTSRLADWDEYFEALHDGAFDLIASPAQTSDIVRVINEVRHKGQKTGASASVGKAHTVSAGGPA